MKIKSPHRKGSKL